MRCVCVCHPSITPRRNNIVNEIKRQDMKKKRNEKKSGAEQISKLNEWTVFMRYRYILD